MPVLSLETVAPGRHLALVASVNVVSSQLYKLSLDPERPGAFHCLAYNGPGGTRSSS